MGRDNISKMPSETDPLLPNNDPAPEIMGEGFSRKTPRNNYQKERLSDAVEVTGQNGDDSPPAEAGLGASPLRTIFTNFTIVVGFALAISVLIRIRYGGPDQAPEVSAPKAPTAIADRVDRILTENPLLDGHNDLAIMIRYLYNNNIYSAKFTQAFNKGGMEFHVDLPRLKAGKVGGAFWSAYVGCPANGTDFSDSNYAEAVSTTLSQIDLLQRLTAQYPKIFSAAVPNSTVAAATFDRDHLLISPFAIEGLHQVGNSLSTLRLYHSLNVKYATLTHNCHNIFADAALFVDREQQLIAAPPLWGGVSERGQVIVQEMNRLGMLVDLSHVSKDTMLDVLGGRPKKWAGSAAPVLFSHSSAYALCPHPRNVPDDVLQLVKKTNSVVMVNFSPDFISCIPSNSSSGLPDLYPPNATLHQVARHVMYIGEEIGFEHVGLGSDFDGILETPKGLDDVSKYPDLIAELLEMGMTDDDAAKVVGRNVLRVWADVDKVAARMKNEGVLPAEDTVLSHGTL